MPRAKPDRPLSEFEGCVLAYLWKRGACTPYSVRRMFLDSPSSHWSGSAGAVYPVLERLEERGLVEATHAPRGKRDGWSYSITRAGRKRCLRWLEPPFGPEITSVPPDPLRTRLSFLGILPPARRTRFFARALVALERELEALEQRLEEDEDEVLSHSAAIESIRSRLRWFAAAGSKPRKRQVP